ncbi:unnamed protein product, partial [Allacma fusca]
MKYLPGRFKDYVACLNVRIFWTHIKFHYMEPVDEDHPIVQEEPKDSNTLTRKERRKLGVQRKR